MKGGLRRASENLPLWWRAEAGAPKCRFQWLGLHLLRRFFSALLLYFDGAGNFVELGKRKFCHLINIHTSPIS